MIHTKILKQTLLVGAAVTMLYACSAQEYEPGAENPLKQLQVKVTDIAATEAWSKGETRVLNTNLLDLDGTPLSSTSIDDEWQIATHVIDMPHSLADEAALTRGTPIYAAQKLPSMGIAIYNAGVGKFDVGSTTANWKRIQAANLNLDGNWSIPSEAVVWPRDKDNLTFFAFSPYPNQANGLSWSADGRTLEYIVPVDVTKQPDLCVATPVKDRQNEDGSGNHVVPFSFKHALTAVTLKASAHQLKIISATVKNVKTKGSLDLSIAVWNNVSIIGSRVMGVNEQVESVPMVDITKSDGHLMMVPQTLDDAAILEFIFDDLNKVPVQRITKTVRLNTITPNKQWVAGKHLFYNLQLKVEYNLTVSPTSVNLAGKAGSYNNPGISYTTNNTQTSPKATANQGWISNIQVSNGKITFDYTENKGLTDRTAIITVTSGLTTKTITVKQAVKLNTEPNSNCYIVAPSGETLVFSVSRANDDGTSRIGASDVITAELLWQDTPGAIGLASSCIASVRTVGVGKDGVIEVTSGSTSGNAVIAVTVNGVIRWSWHIWVTNYDPSTTNKTHNGKTWMDRNIGATTNIPGNINSVGTFYQWGRKDPFASSGGFGNNDSRKVYDAAGIEVVYSYKPAYSVKENFENALQTPMRYYHTTWPDPNQYFQWSGNTLRNRLWTATRTVYDPCPLGWKVPSQIDFGQLSATSTTVKGLNLGDLGYFPFGGKRSCWGGNIEGSGSSGGCWTSYVGNYDGTYLNYIGSSPTFETYSTCSGLPVRCVKE